MASQQQRSAPAAPSQTQTQPATQPPQAESSTRSPRVLRLRGAHQATGRSVQWAEDVVDNEGLGRKSSKVCCIYHRPKAVGESSDESSSDSSDSDSDSDSDGPPDGARPANGKGKDCGHGHGHNHNHGRGRDKGDKGKGKDKDKRAPSPNAYEKVPKPRPRDQSGDVSNPGPSKA